MPTAGERFIAHQSNRSMDGGELSALVKERDGLRYQVDEQRRVNARLADEMEALRHQYDVLGDEKAGMVADVARQRDDALTAVEEYRRQVAALQERVEGQSVHLIDGVGLMDRMQEQFDQLEVSAADLVRERDEARAVAEECHQVASELRKMVVKRNRMLKRMVKHARRERRRASEQFRVTAQVQAKRLAAEAQAEYWQDLFLSLHEHHQDSE